MTWTGEERREDNTSVRLALLEKAQSDTQVRHEENKKSLIAVHVRITTLGKDFEAALSKGLDAIIDKLDEKNLACAEHDKRLTKVETTQTWLERWVAAGWLLMGSIFGMDRISK